MYTTMFSMLLASAGLASGADGGYGGYGSYGSYGCPGTYAGGCGPYFYPQYPYQVMPGPWNLSAAAENSSGKEQDKRLADLTSVMQGLVQKMRDIEVTAHQQSDLTTIQKQMAQMTESIRQMNEGLERRVTEAINSKLAETKAPTTPVALDPQLQDRLTRLGELESRLRLLEDARRINAHDSNSEALNKVVNLLEVMTKHNTDLKPVFDDIRFGLNKIVLQHQDAPVESKPIRTGHALTRGLIIVSLPADAQLFLDGQPSIVGTNLRTFISPELEPGKSYFYTLRVEVERHRKTFTDTQKVYFQPGREVHVSFDHIDAAITNILKKE